MSIKSFAKGRLPSKYNSLVINPSLSPTKTASVFDASRRVKAYLVSCVVERRLAILDCAKPCDTVDLRFSTMSYKWWTVVVQSLLLLVLACVERNLANKQL